MIQYRTEFNIDSGLFDLWIADFFAGAFESRAAAEFWAGQFIDNWHRAHSRMPNINVGPGALKEFEQRILSLALFRSNNNQGQAAKILGMKRTTFIEKLRRHDMLKKANELLEETY